MTETKTRDDIEALKKNWVNDPCWEIETTEGFEEYEKELMAYSEEQKAIWDKRYEERKAREDASWNKSMMAKGIDKDIRSSDMRMGRIEEDGASGVEVEMIVVAHLQVKATLLLAHQLERIADQVDDGHESAFRDALWKAGV